MPPSILLQPCSPGPCSQPSSHGPALPALRAMISQPCSPCSQGHDLTAMLSMLSGLCSHSHAPHGDALTHTLTCPPSGPCSRPCPPCHALSAHSTSRPYYKRYSGHTAHR